jgi:hypothetical protein
MTTAPFRSRLIFAWAFPSRDRQGAVLLKMLFPVIAILAGLVIAICGFFKMTTTPFRSRLIFG